MERQEGPGSDDIRQRVQKSLGVGPYWPFVGAKGIRQRAWEALGAGSYWPFVGGNFVLTLVCLFAALVPSVLFVVVLVSAAVLSGFGQGADLSLASIPPDLVFIAAAGSVILSVVWTYVLGFKYWGDGAMALAAADRKFRFGLCFSGWGFGWKMAWTLMVAWTYLTLWYLLLIVPGVLKTLSYSMVKYVQIEHPDWTANRCIGESVRLMKGNRWRLCKLGLSFIGWYLLIVLLAPFGGAGLALVFFAPYLSTAFACFYRQLQAEKGPPAAV